MATLVSGSVRTRDQLRTLSDTDLMQAIADGDDAAFGILEERYRLNTLRYVQLCVRDADLAEDIVQEIYMRVYKHRRNFRLGCSFLTWLSTITRNQVINASRNRARRKRVMLTFTDLQWGEDEALAFLGCDPFPDPLEELVQKEEEHEAASRTKSTARRVRRRMRTLPEHMRTTLTMRELEGKTYEEIAAATHTNSGTVKSRIFRARTAIRQSVSDRR